MKDYISKTLLLLLIEFLNQAYAEYCSGSTYGHSCPHPQKCCGETCCIPESYEPRYRGFRLSVWNMWYFWFIVIFILMSCFGGCGYWRRRQLLLARQQSMMQTRGGYSNYCNLGNLPTTGQPTSHTSTAATMPIYHGFEGSYFQSSVPPPPPPQAYTAADAAHGSFPAPPPYSEVVSKPDAYPMTKDNLPPYPGEPLPIASNK